MKAIFADSDASQWWLTRYSKSELFAFMRGVSRMPGFRVVIYLVDQDNGVKFAVAATRSDIRGRDFIRTGFSHHLLVMPLARWEMLLSGLNIKPFGVVDAYGQVIPEMTDDHLPPVSRSKLR